MEEKSFEELRGYLYIVENAISGAYLIQDGVFRYVNPWLANTFGYKREEIIGRLGPLDLTHPDDRIFVREYIRLRVEGRIDKIAYNFRGLKKDESIIFCEVLGKRIDFLGKPAIVGTLLDISERRRAEASLKESEEKYRRLFENAPDVIYTISKDGIITSLSPAFERITGWMIPEWIGRQFAEIVHPENTLQVSSQVPRIL